MTALIASQSLGIGSALTGVAWPLAVLVGIATFALVSVCWRVYVLSALPEVPDLSLETKHNGIPSAPINWEHAAVARDAIIGRLEGQIKTQEASIEAV